MAVRGIAILLAAGCVTGQRQSDQFTVDIAADELGTYDCVLPPDAIARVTEAWDATFTAWQAHGWPVDSTIRGTVTICFVPDTELGLYGRHWVNRIWISMEDPDGAMLWPYDTALVHEFIHHLLLLTCALNKTMACDEDGNHVTADLWSGAGGDSSVEFQANQAWRD